MGLAQFGPVDAVASRVHVKARERLMSLTIAILSTGCAIQPYQTYSGPKLPSAETARIAADQASIISIDGMELPNGRQFMLRAGVHALSASGIDANGYLMTLCLAAEGGANYRVRLGGIDRSVPEIYDQDRGSVVRTLLVPIGQDCAPPPRGSTAVAVLVPSGGRVHRGRKPPPPPPYPQDERHVRDGSVILGPQDRQAVGVLLEIPLRIVLALLFCLRR
jgi:hypothetical protein